MNNYKDHLLILSEDDIYKDIATGFFNNVRDCNKKIERSAGGWKKLIALFKDEYEADVYKYQHRHVLLLLDLDEDSERLDKILNDIPSDIKQRVFVLSCKNEGETLKRVLGGGMPEKVGKQLFQSCSDNSHTKPGNPWLCDELKHNQTELSRIAKLVQPWLVK